MLPPKVGEIEFLQGGGEGEKKGEEESGGVFSEGEGGDDGCGDSMRGGEVAGESVELWFEWEFGQ